MWSLVDRGQEGKKASSRTLSLPHPTSQLIFPNSTATPHIGVVVTRTGSAGELGFVPTVALLTSLVLSGVGPQPGEAPGVIPCITRCLISPGSPGPPHSKDHKKTVVGNDAKKRPRLLFAFAQMAEVELRESVTAF